MNYKQVETVVSQRTGLSVAQNAGKIKTAITGALEELGANVDVSYAQLVKDFTITSGANKISRPANSQRILSVGYKYLSGGQTVIVPLDSAKPTTFDDMNAGLQDTNRDDITYFMVSGEYIYVGPGNVLTGGSITVRWQRELGINDIDYLPSAAILIDGAIANLLPIDNEAGILARRRFVRSIAPTEEAIQPVGQKFNEIELSAQVLRDDAYRRGL